MQIVRQTNPENADDIIRALDLNRNGEEIPPDLLAKLEPGELDEIARAIDNLAVPNVVLEKLGIGAVRGERGPRLELNEPRPHPAGSAFDLPVRDARNFLDAEPVPLQAGTKIFRVVDPKSRTNGGYWTFELPASKAEWRNGYAVLKDFNQNGSYVEYIVPEGGLNAWVGETASQNVRGIPGWIQPGGLEQIFVPNSRELIPADLPRIPTLWED